MSSDGRSLVQELKRSAHQRRFSLPVDGEFVLRPVAVAEGQLDPLQVRCLTEWRNRFVHSFLHEFTADETRTARWLTDVVGADDTRILFMLENGAAEPVGYLGLGFIEWARGYGEADAIVRGRELPRGLMKRALLTLLDWAQRSLGLQKLGVRVLGDNPACEFYRRCGFADVERQPLERREVADGVQWIPGDGAVGDGERHLIHFRFAQGAR